MVILTHLDFGTLISYHKQEAAEALTYGVITLTIIFGLLSYIGSAKFISKAIRVILAFVFFVAHISLLQASLGSIKMYDAIHEEIKFHVATYPDSFIKGSESRLYCILNDLSDPPTIGIKIGYYVLGVLIVLAILTIGEGKVCLFTVKPKKNYTI